ncbi:hypothetical protein NGM07_11650 [Halorussus vallis]|uniref:hypothetical protein n=1 Tax=Halorussus vallis TaxID=2953749 RepID=UPI00209F2322|nr:hypothetical protein [Halorussus vallis]USZ74106.1 hypothetical protein NGM07_11650 [Halorussus vallis]
MLNPFYLDPLGLGAQRYGYSATEVTPVDSDLRYETPPPAEIETVEDVDCYSFGSETSVECALQNRFTNGRNFTTLLEDAPNTSWGTYVRLNGNFYRRYYRGEFVARNRTGRRERRTRVTVRLLPVSAEDLLDNVSTEVDDISGAYRRVVERGRIRTDEPLAHDRSWAETGERPEGRFVRADGGYYLVGLDSYDPPLEHRWLYSSVGVLLGVACLGYGFRTESVGER